MRTETDPTEDQKPWKPFGEKVVPPTSERDEWAPVPDAPGVEISYKTGMRRTNVRVPNAWVDDLAMQAKDAPLYKMVFAQHVKALQIRGIEPPFNWNYSE